MGIAAQDLPKLFEKFQQLQRLPQTGGSKGTGLGLAISKGLVELHGGRIWATSGEGTGSTFTFTMPRYQLEEVFVDYLKDAIDEAKRSQRSLSIVALAVANFQELKALYGLEEATRLLRDVEGVVAETVRRSAQDVVVRWQRGEVVAILPAVGRKETRVIASRIKQSVEARQFKIGESPLSIPVAVATATYPEEAMTDKELLTLGESRLQKAGGARVRVLVVDDEPKFCQMLKGTLELREYEVLVAGSGLEAIKQLKQDQVDLILLDLIMPVMDGYELYHLLKENDRTKDIPVIIVTGKEERRDDAKGLDGPSYNYIAKPFQIEDLLAKIQEALRRSRAVGP